MPANIKEYSDDYKEKCKVAWYAAKRPAQFAVIQTVIPEDEQGRKPLIRTLRQWKKDMMWDFWADELDAKSIVIVENELVNERAEMFKRQARMSKEAAELAFNKLKVDGFDTSSSAVSALFKAMEQERISMGVSEFEEKVAQMGSLELRNEIMGLISRASENNQITDLEVISDVKKEEKDGQEQET